MEESDKYARFEYFRDQFVLFYRSCKITAEHLAYHIDRTMCYKYGESDGAEESWTILQSLIADENFAQQSREDDTGIVPTTFEWDSHFSGSAFTALLRLADTDLYSQYETDSDTIWTEICGSVTTFGKAGDESDISVLTMIPSVAPSPTIYQEELTVFKNGFVLNDVHGEAMNGSQPSDVKWAGLLLVEHLGYCYFCASKTTSEDSLRSLKGEGYQRWIVTIEPGQKT